MELNYEKILKKANEHYLRAKIKQGLIKESSLPYMAPELIPEIYSDQVKSMLRAIVEEINK